MMPPTGVFDGEQKPEAKKRCERAKPNTARLYIHAARPVAPRRPKLEYCVLSATAVPCLAGPATRWHAPPHPVSLDEKSTFEVPICCSITED